MAINEDSRCNELVENEMIVISKFTFLLHYQSLSLHGSHAKSSAGHSLI